jgi:hypothetical protein
VNGQNKYNHDGIINAIPIIIYHKVGEPSTVGYNTDLDLFEKEMKYLHDNGFTLLTMSDLDYDNKANFLYVKQNQDQVDSGKVASIAAENLRNNIATLGATKEGN